MGSCKCRQLRRGAPGGGWCWWWWPCEPTCPGGQHGSLGGRQPLTAQTRGEQLRSSLPGFQLQHLPLQHGPCGRASRCRPAAEGVGGHHLPAALHPAQPAPQHPSGAGVERDGQVGMPAVAKLPGDTLGSPAFESPALTEPMASPKAGGSSTSAPKQGCSPPSAPAGACTASAWIRVTHFMGAGRVSGRAQAVTLHGHSALAPAPAFAASPRLQWLCQGWDGALTLPRSSCPARLRRRWGGLGQGRLGWG